MDYIAIDDIVISEYQREPMPWTVQEIAESMQDHGYNEAYPIVLDESDVLVDGGHRLKACGQCGVERVPFVRKPEGVPNLRYAMMCNEDRAKGREDDVFDLAEYCWKMAAKSGISNSAIAEAFGWNSKPSVTYYKNIKELLHPLAWNVARYSLTKNVAFVNGQSENVVNPKLTIVNAWVESHFRALLNHLPFNGQKDNATMRAQLALIRECLYRWQKQPRDAKGRTLKVTAKWIQGEAIKLAWHIKLKRQAIETVKPWVGLWLQVELFKSIDSGRFGNQPSDEGVIQMNNVIEALNGKAPQLYVGYAEDMGQIESDSVDVIITSPPYNLGKSNWRMGGLGRQHRGEEVGYDKHDDNMSEKDYQNWQIQCLQEMYRVSKDGASLFYNHKIRNQDGQIIHPWEWLSRDDNPWVVRQELIWDRGSTHNHNATYLWPEDERIYWMVKGDRPNLYNESIGYSTIWSFHGPRASTWHPAPFPEEIPRRCLQAIGGRDLVVLDPFAGSCTTLKVALSEFGFDAIGFDISEEYLDKAREENGWHCTQEG